MVSHLNSFKYVEMDGEFIETPFQAFEVVPPMVVVTKISSDIPKADKVVPRMVSLKDAQQVVCNSHSEVWGRIVDPPVNKNRVSLGFSVKNDKGKSMKPKSAAGKYQDIFLCGVYLHPNVSEINAIVEDEAES